MRYLLVVKDSMDQSYAIAEVKRRLGGQTPVSISEDQWKITQHSECVVFVDVDNSNVLGIYQWYSETTSPAPFPSGTLLYFKVIEH